MARARSPNRDKAFEIYKEHGGYIANREIAKLLDIFEKTISGWKVKDKWNESLNGVLQKEIRRTTKEKRNKGGNLVIKMQKNLFFPLNTSQKKHWSL